MNAKLMTLTIVSVLALVVSGCNKEQSMSGMSTSLGSVDPTDNGGTNGSGGAGGGPVGSSGAPSANLIVAGNGASFAGVGNLGVPTAEGLVVRIQNGLEKSVNPLAGNFRTSLAQVKTNLPKVPDPTKASGYDQAQLLVYGACSDLTTGATPIMRSRYNVIPTGTIASNQAALVAAGVRMMDQHTAGLASKGPTSAQVSQIFTSLVQQLVTPAGTGAANTSTIAFMAVCIAANTAGSTMMGF